MAPRVVVDMVHILLMVHQVVVVDMVHIRRPQDTPLAADMGARPPLDMALAAGMAVHRRATVHRLRVMAAPQAVATLLRLAAVAMPEQLVRKVGS